jgi:Ca2+-binding EF-hand superfamily protein
LDLGHAGKEGFKKLLTHRFGSVIRGWRFGLDVAGNNRLSFTEFCTACRNIGFDGNMLGLWKELDDDNSGVVTLQELEPRAHHCTELFRQLLRQKYGNTLKAWKYGLDENGNDRVDFEELEEVCKKVKYPYGVRELFDFLIPDAGRQFLCIEDMDMQAQAARDRGDWNMITVPHAPKEIEVDMDDVFSSMEKRPDAELKKKDEDAKDSRRVSIQDRGGGRNFEWNLYLSNQQKNSLELKRAKQLAKDVGPKNLNEFKRTLCVRYGSMYLAWRYGLDISGDDKLCFQEFCAAARANEFRGSLLKVWKELDDDNSGVVTLEEFDPKAHHQVELMRSTLLDKFPNLLQAWQKGLDLDGNGRLDEHEWLARFQDLGFEGNAKYLFHLLKPKTRVFMTIDDFDAVPLHAAKLMGYFDIFT